MGVFARMMAGLAAEVPDHKTVSIDAIYLKAHRTASSLRLKKGAWTSDRADKRWYEYEVACRNRHDWTADPVLHNRGPSQRLHRGQSPGE